MSRLVDKTSEHFVDRMLRHRVERLEGSASKFFEVMGIKECLDAYMINQDMQQFESPFQYQIRCRLEILEQRYERIDKAYNNLASDAVNEAMRLMTEYYHMTEAS